MSHVQYLRLLSICTAMVVGFWLPLKILNYVTVHSVDLFVDLLISCMSVVNIYIHFVKHELNWKEWKSWIDVSVVLDLICVLPLMLVQDYFFQSVGLELVFINLLTLRHVTKIKDFLDEFDNLKPIVYRLVPLMMMMPLLVHLIATGWIAIGSGSAEITEDLVLNYVKAFYWAMTTLTTVGYGDIVAKTPVQMIYAATTQILGVGVFGYVLSNVASLLSRLDAARESHMNNLDHIEGFMNSYHIPSPVRSKVRAYYHYIWKEHKGRLDKSVLTNLPAKLQSEINYAINESIIEKVSFLKSASREMLEDVMLALDHRVFVPGEKIFRAGDPGDCLYMIHAGEVEILTPDGNHIVDLKEGAVFGEIALLSEGPRTATVKAKSYCDLYALPKTDFYRIVNTYPDFKTEMDRLIEERRAPKAA